MRVVELSKTFRFDAAHWLPLVAEGHKCGRLHGHSWVVVVTVRGEVSAETGWYCDYADITRVTKPLVDDLLDHRCMNELPGLENPTSEMLAIWLWERIAPALPGLFEIEVRETPNGNCRYRGEVER